MKRIFPLLLLAVSLTFQAVPVAADSWTPTGSMAVARQGHTATLLNNGTVLIVGGDNTGALLYGPGAGLFGATNGTPSYEPRQGATTTLLGNGTVLIVGGDGGPQSAQIYYPTTRTFALTTGSPTYIHSFHTATLLPDGRVLIAGGQNSTAGPQTTNLAELYDPSTGNFARTGSLTVDRSGHSATLLSNGKVLIAGGTETTTDGNGITLSSTELFDPSSQTFTPGPSMSVGRTGTMATTLPNGKVLLIGWLSAAADLYDPATNTVTTTGSMITPHADGTATLLTPGGVLVAGGFTATGPITTNSAELYDPVAGVFTATASMSVARQVFTATLLPDGRVLVVGGYNPTNGDLASAELYLPPEVYVSTAAGHQILRVDAASGATSVLFTWHPDGSTPPYPEGLAVGPDNLIYAADPTNDRIIRIDQSGGNLSTVYSTTSGCGSSCGPPGPQGPSFSTTGQLTFNTTSSNGVWQISFDSTDTPQPPVQIIPVASGEEFGEGTTFNLLDEVLIVDQANNVVLQQTAPGANTASSLITTNLNAPMGVAVNSSGNIFVSNFGSGKVEQFTSGGAHVNTYATFAAPDAPTFMQFDASGNLYVVTVQYTSGTHGKVWRVPAVASGQTSTPVLLVDLYLLYNGGSNSIGLLSDNAMGLALSATTYTTPQQPVSPGTSTTFTNGTTASVTEVLPPDVDMGDAVTAYMALSFIYVPPAVFSSTRLPGIAQSPNWSGGITPVPPGTTCTVIANTGGNCMVMRHLCFDSNHSPIVPCNITAPTTPIQLTAHYKTQVSPSCPAYIIADDDQKNWANITTSFNPADPTISGGTKKTNTDTAVVDLGSGNCATSDNVPPTTTAVTSPLMPNGTNNWFTTSPVSVILTSTDDTLVKEIDYSINGVAQPTVPGASTLFQIANQGATTISFFATDTFNNVETPAKSVTVKIDTTPPVVSVTGVTNGATYTLGAVPTAGCSTTDAMSGVATPASLTLTGGVPPGVGSFTATCSGAVDNAGNTAAPVTATYTVTPGPLASVSPSIINFGTVYLGTITIKSVTVTNQGDAPMTITDPLLSIVSGGNSKEFVALNLCPKSLAAGKSCTILVSFVAGPFYAPQTAILKVMDNAPGSPQTVALSATVINPKASLSSYSMNFGKQSVNKTSAAKTVTLTNTGTGTTPLVLSTLTVSGDFALASGTTCANGGTLAANVSCTINVTFTPTTQGLRSGSVVITDNAQNSPQKISLSGTGK